jgi:hypothetical protein
MQKFSPPVVKNAKILAFSSGKCRIFASGGRKCKRKLPLEVHRGPPQEKRSRASRILKPGLLASTENSSPRATISAWATIFINTVAREFCVLAE